MSHMKIATKILEVMKAIPTTGNPFEYINKPLVEQKLIAQTKYEIAESKERTTTQGIVYQIITVSCELTIIDAESDETIVNIALGTGINQGSGAIISAQEMAQRYAWLGALGVMEQDEPEVYPNVIQPEFVVETPESKLIDQIKALWKWGDTELESYFIKKRGKGLSELNLPELTVERNELESYIKGNS